MLQGMNILYENNSLVHYYFPIVKGVEKMNLFINTSDVKNFIKHGFEYKNLMIINITV